MTCLGLFYESSELISPAFSSQPRAPKTQYNLGIIFRGGQVRLNEPL